MNNDTNIDIAIMTLSMLYNMTLGFGVKLFQEICNCAGVVIRSRIICTRCVLFYTDRKGTQLKSLQ